MRILIDIGHPGHVHLFKNFAWEMQKRGHHILFTCREKEFEIELLKASGFNFISFGKKFKSLKGKIKGLILFNFKMYKYARNFKPDLFLSAGSIYAAHVSSLMRKPHVSLEDTGNMEQIRLYLPFTNKILIPKSLHKKFGAKEVRYNGLHELFYLHPKRIKFENSSKDLIELPLKKEIAFIRLIAWNASHDKLNQKGGIKTDLYELIEILENKNFKVIISSEGMLPEKFEKYKLNFAPEHLHYLLKISTISIGEGGTTATESSLLGTPTILINPQSKYIGSRKMLQNEYDLLYYFDTFKDALLKINHLLDTVDLKKKHKSKLDRFLKDNIDCTAFLVDYIEDSKWKS